MHRNSRKLCPFCSELGDTLQQQTFIMYTQIIILLLVVNTVDSGLLDGMLFITKEQIHELQKLVADMNRDSKPGKAPSEGLPRRPPQTNLKEPPTPESIPSTTTIPHTAERPLPCYSNCETEWRITVPFDLINTYDQGPMYVVHDLQNHGYQVWFEAVCSPESASSCDLEYG